MYAHQRVLSHSPRAKEEVILWFAMRVTYNREMSVKQLLDCAGIENYVPLRRTIKQRMGRKVRVVIPAVRGLLFVKCTRSVIAAFKTKLPHLQFMTRHLDGRNVPIVVPEVQMDSFIKATSLADDSVEYLGNVDPSLQQGMRVRIHGGELDGIEGVYRRVTGKRSRRLIVQVENVAAVAVDVTSVDFIEILK